MKNNNIKKILDDVGIKYTENAENYFFDYCDMSYWANKKGHVGVSSNYFGKIPHVMPNGRLCISGNIDINFWDSESLLFIRTLSTYAPWLFNLPPNYKVAEMISELEFYIIKLLGKKCFNVSKEKICINFQNKVILNPDDLWIKLGTINDNYWYKFYPLELENHFVYVMRKDDIYYVNFDNYSKSRIRVSGFNYNSYNNKSAFIGVGSVNSYIIKHLCAHGMSNMILIDDDIVEVDNMYRYAFPYINQKKIDATEIFVKATLSNCEIKKINEKIDSDSEYYLEDASIIYVSVDNYVAWLKILFYLEKNMKSNIIVCLVGVDIFGGFGKIVKIKFEGNLDKFRTIYIKFLNYSPTNGEKRKQMIGNGCGKSIAMYNEENLLNLAQEVTNLISFEEIKHVSF